MSSSSNSNTGPNYNILASFCLFFQQTTIELSTWTKNCFHQLFLVKAKGAYQSITLYWLPLSEMPNYRLIFFVEIDIIFDNAFTYAGFKLKLCFDFVLFVQVRFSRICIFFFRGHEGPLNFNLYKI